MALRRKKLEKPIIYMELFGLKAESFKIKNEVEAFFAEHSLQLKVFDWPEAAEYIGGDQTSLIRFTTNLRDFKKRFAMKLLALKSIQGIEINIVIFNKANFFALMPKVL